MRAALYRAYNADGALLYVGISLSVGARLANHGSHSPWWGDVSRMTFAWFPSQHDALAAERAAILAERPLYNRRYSEQAPPKLSEIATRAFRIERDKLDRLAEIAAAEHRTTVQKLRVMIEREIADAEVEAA